MRQITLGDIVSYKVTANFAGSNPEYTYIVDWGDGSTDVSAGLEVHYVAHRYSQAGKFEPVVTIRDDKKGCWKTFDLDTIYVLGITLSVTTTQYQGGTPSDPVYPGFTLVVDGSYDAETTNGLKFKTKWYFGDGIGSALNYWSTEKTINSNPYIEFNKSYGYTSAGIFSAWVAMQVTSSEIDSINGKSEISDAITLTFSELGPQEYPLVGGQITRTDFTESSASFDLKVSSGTGPFNVSVDWGDGSTSTYTEVPMLSTYTMQHSFPSTSGATMYTPIFTITDSVGNIKDVKYTVYAVPKLALIPEFAGTALGVGVTQSTMIYAGKSPYAVYFDVSIRESPEADETPRCRIKIVTDPSTPATSQTLYYPNGYSWYGPGARTIVITDVTKDFTIELDHNVSVDSYNSMLIRAYVIDSNGSVSQKVNLVKFGTSTNVGVTGV